MSLRTAAAPAVKLSAERVWSKLHERYQSIDILGQGTYGIVYKAEELLADEKSYVALKRTALDPNLTHGIPDTALREIAILKDMNHPNIVDTKEFSCNSNRVYLVMELLDKDLKQYIRANQKSNKRLSGNSVKHLMFKVLQGIAHLHNHRILHRDLKPHNILVSDDLSTVKLADFGLARAEHCCTKTLTHEVVTLWYRPPEILLGDCVYDKSVDIWSLGCILAELLLDAPLFDGESELGTLMKIFGKLGTIPVDSWPPNAMQLRYQFPNFPLATAGVFKSMYGKFENQTEALMVEDLILSMLHLDPAKRLDASGCITHPWFDSIRWNKEYRIYNNHYPPQHAKRDRMRRSTQAEQTSLLPEDTCLTSQLTTSLLLQQSMDADIYRDLTQPRKGLSLHVSDNQQNVMLEDDTNSTRGQLMIDHLLLTLGGLSQKDVLARVQTASQHVERPSTDPNTIYDGKGNTPETPCLTTPSTHFSMAKDKQGDRADNLSAIRSSECDDSRLAATVSASSLGKHRSMHGSRMATRYLQIRQPNDDVRLHCTPLPHIDSRRLSKTSPSMGKRGAKEYEHHLDKSLNDDDYVVCQDPIVGGRNVDEDYMKSVGASSITNFLTPANFVSKCTINESGVMASFARRITKDVENSLSALSSRISGALHWPEAMPKTPSSKH